MNRLPLPILYFAFSVTVASGAEHRFEESGTARPPEAYVYDPIRGVSERNAKALQAGEEMTIETHLQPDDSFTLEAFAKPIVDLQTKPRQILPVFSLGGNANVLVAGIRRSPPPHSYQWWHARYRSGSERPADLSRNRYNGITMIRGEQPWRHLAVTWDAETLTLSAWLDYRLLQSTVFDKALECDLSQLDIGRCATFDRSFEGAIDEVRVTSEVLKPWQFLRATAVPLTNVSFAPESAPALPPDYGHVDVRLHYGAIGDGKHDDTEAIRRAFQENDNRVPIAYKTVYFPAGTYLISDSIRFSRFMVVRGAGKDKTTIRLKDRAEGYDDPEIPKPAFAVGYDWPYVDRPKKNRAGNVIGNYLFDLSIDTGSGNPAALGLDFHCNNVGCVENVDIRSGDGSGLVGLDFKRGWPGPCLIKNVSVTGFDYGIDAAWREYSLVFSGIQLRDQRVAAIRNRGNILSMERVVSENTVPAVQNESGGLVVLLASQLKGGSAGCNAIESNNASLYVRNVEVDGYETSLVDTRNAEAGPPETLARRADSTIGEYFTGPFAHAWNPAKLGSLKLPVRQTPEISRPPVSDWVNVLDYRDLVVDGDWAPAIQAAVDAGKPLVYFPPDAKYEIHQDVILRGAVRIFLGGSPKTGISNGTKEVDQPTDGPAVVLGDDLPFFQFEMLGTNHVRHASPATLVFRHCGTGHITAESGCGDLFIEDAGGKWRFNEHQRVWARQLNPETKGIPEIINNGGQLWVLGLKTEYLSTKIENRNGARTEILGGLMYPVHPVDDESLPMFLNENSDISLVHAVSVYKKNHKIYMRDTQGGETREHRHWHWIAGRPISNLYRSDSASATEGTIRTDDTRPPNVILILADDLAPGDFASRNGGLSRTPHLDRLAAESVSFSQAYSASCVCAPARAALLTGRYPHRTGVVTLNMNRYPELTRLHRDETTIADVLQANGYVTGLIGKWHCGTAPDCHPLKRGFDEFEGFSGSQDLSYFRYTLDVNGQPAETTDQYLTEDLSRRAIDLVRRHRSRSFFLHLAHYAPHRPLEAPAKLIESYRDEGLDDSTATIYAMIEMMDRGIGELLAELKRLQLERHTVVIFASDNGPDPLTGARFNLDLRGSKYEVYEGGIRVPLMIRWPGVFEPQTCHQTVHFVDLLPTILDLCKVSRPTKLPIDGESFHDLLQGRSADRTAPRYWQWNRGVPNYTHNAAVRQGPWKLVKPYVTRSANPPDSTEPAVLYDLTRDPAESTDVSASNSDRYTQMLLLLDRWSEQVERDRKRDQSR